MNTQEVSAREIFNKEYELTTITPRKLFPYLNTTEGLSQWFAKEVIKDENDTSIFIFRWQNEEHYARIVHRRMNKSIKYEFLNDDKQTVGDPNFLEMTVEFNDLTESTFLGVSDYFKEESHEDLDELWGWLTEKLQDAIDEAKANE